MFGGLVVEQPASTSAAIIAVSFKLKLFMFRFLQFAVLAIAGRNAAVRHDPDR